MLYCFHSAPGVPPNVAEKETHRADGDLRIVLETVQKHRIDQRVFGLPAASSDSGCGYLTTQKKV